MFAMRNLFWAVLFVAVCVFPSCSECTDGCDESEDSSVAGVEGAPAEESPHGEPDREPPAESGPAKTLEPKTDAQNALAKALAGGQVNTSGQNPFAGPGSDKAGPGSDKASPGSDEKDDPKLEFVVDDPNAVATPSGLHYSVITEGEGPKPDPYAKVKVNYKGTLMDGTEFDSTYRRKEPFGFKLFQVRPEGLKEGIGLMSVGAKYKLFIPPALGFGERGIGSKIPPNAGLIYEVELVGFEPGPEMPQFREGNPDAQKTTEEGLIYEVLKEGTGPAPGTGMLVDIEFAFWTLGGELVDASAIRGGPWKIKVGKAKEKIFNLGTLLLKEGGRNRYVVPPELAFGKRGRGALVPPNATVVFEIELLKVYVPLEVPPFGHSPNSKLIETGTGLQYEVIKEGEGEPPSIGSVVSVHYAGWLEDGTLFDNSFKKGIPTTFQLSRVIAGWTEGVQLMKPGAIYKFTIPPELAYGDRGQPPRIPGNSTLIFHIELIEVKK